MSDRNKTIEIPAVPRPEGHEDDYDELTPVANMGAASDAPATQRHPMPSGTHEGHGGAATEKAISVAAAATRERATLTVIAGMNAGQVFSVDRELTVVGRGLDAEVVLDDS